MLHFIDLNFIIILRKYRLLVWNNVFNYELVAVPETWLSPPPSRECSSLGTEQLISRQLCLHLTENEFRTRPYASSLVKALMSLFYSPNVSSLDPLRGLSKTCQTTLNTRLARVTAISGSWTNNLLLSLLLLLTWPEKEHLITKYCKWKFQYSLLICQREMKKLSLFFRCLFSYHQSPPFWWLNRIKFPPEPTYLPQCHM